MIPLERVLNHKIESKGSFINGAWKYCDRVSGVIEAQSPANLEWVLPPLPYCFDHVEDALDAAHKAQKKWSQESVSFRIDTLKRFGSELVKRQQRLARLISIESGKPFDEALGEASLLPNKINVTIEEALALVAPRFVDLGAQGRGEILFRPKGVLAVIGPFNFPVHLSHGHIVPALLSGNVCILKPSEKTPYSAQEYIEAWEAARGPAGVLQMVQGPGDTAIRLCRHSLLSGVLATCSFEVGVKITRDLAENPEKIVALEMGGKNAALVWDLNDLEPVAQALVRSAFGTTGQRCTALSRCYVKRNLVEPLSQRVHALAKELVIQQPFEEDPKPFMGPLITSAAKDKFLRYSGIAESEGAEALMRPKGLEGLSKVSRRPLPPGHYVTPSIHLLKEANPKSAYQAHEIFGPDIFFCPVDEVEQGVEAINQSRYGLATSVFCTDEKLFDKIADSVESGLIYWNRPTVGASARLPFGGWKRSGNHRPAGIFAIYSSTQVQSRIK